MNKIVWILLASTIGLGLVSLRLVGELRSERARNAALESVLDASSSTVAEHLDESTGAWERVEPPAPNTTTPGSPSPPAMAAGYQVFSPPIVMSATPGSEAAIEQMRAMQERQRTLMRDPAYRAAMLAQQRNSLRTMNENVGRALGLSEEQSGKLLDLLAEQQLRMQEASMDDWAEQNNDPADVADRMRKYQQISDQQAQELKALLGATGYRSYQEYQATLGARQQVNQLNMALASAGVPLTKEQVEPLTRALHQSQTKALQTAARDQQRWASTAARPTQVDLQKYQIDMMREQNKQMRAAASSVLNDEQMDAYTAQQERDVEGMEAYLHLVQAQADAVERGVVPPMPGSEDAIGFNHVYTGGATAGFVSTP